MPSTLLACCRVLLNLLGLEQLAHWPQPVAYKAPRRQKMLSDRNTVLTGCKRASWAWPLNHHFWQHAALTAPSHALLQAAKMRPLAHTRTLRWPTLTLYLRNSLLSLTRKLLTPASKSCDVGDSGSGKSLEIRSNERANDPTWYAMLDACGASRSRVEGWWYMLPASKPAYSRSRFAL